MVIRVPSQFKRAEALSSASTSLAGYIRSSSLESVTGLSTGFYAHQFGTNSRVAVLRAIRDHRH